MTKDVENEILKEFYMKKILITFLASLVAVVGVQTVLCPTAGEEEAAVTAYRLLPEAVSEPAESSQPEEAVSEEPVVREPQTVHLLSAGDNLIHSSLYEQAAARSENGGYDFSYLYENVADYLSGADISTLNQETVIAPSREPATYPCFNSPPELASYIIDQCGFDVLNLANNHCLDQGTSGLEECLSFWAEQYPDVLTTGIYQNEEDYADIRTTEVNGITFAFLGMTELTNGLALSSDSDVVLVQALDDAGLARLQEQIEEADRLADVVIMNVHWGNEYSFTPTERQTELAEWMTDWGVDIVIGHHPHVLQPVETRTTADGRTALIAYSLGNFASAQSDAYCLVGGILDYTVSRETEDGEVVLTGYSLTPTVTHYDSGYSNNRIYLLQDYTDELAAGHGVRARYSSFSLSYIDSLLEEVVGREALDGVTFDEDPSDSISE